MLLQVAALDELVSMTDSELEQELIGDNESIDVIENQVKSSMREAAAKALRNRLISSKQVSKVTTGANTSVFLRPSIEQIKQIVQGMFQTDDSLRLAFRDGKRQSDADWQSLYDDLVAMGAIKPKNNEI